MKIDKFKEKKNSINNEINQNKKILDVYVNIRLIFILALIITIISAISNANNRTIMIIISSILLFITIILTFLMSKYVRIDKKLNYKLEVINSYLLRFSDKYTKDNNTGLEYCEKQYFETDLDVFGRSSLYNYINFGRTPYGKKYLANSLEANLRSKEEIESRNKSINELSDNLDNVVDIVASSFEYNKLNSNIDINNIESGLSALENVYKPNIFKVILSSLYIIALITVIVLQSIKLIPPYIFLIMIFIAFFLCMFINTEAAKLSDDMSQANHILYGYDELIDEINKIKFNDTNLIKLQNNVSKLKSKSVKVFNVISGFSESRKNILFQIISNGLFMLDNYIVLAYYNWQKKYKNNIKEALESIGHIEELISLSTIGLVKENVVNPIVSDKFDFEDIRHPLIVEEKCVPNSFIFKNTNIITGSNMSGKTTFMRSIGTNYILFLAGAKVCATRFEAPILKLFTSMKVVDDVNNNISTFYGEILRIKAICDYVKLNKPMLVLVDEIFKGTNTKDRIVGAKATIEKLNRNDIYSIVTTHDPELCQIENVSNFHFLEYYENDEIKFDYKIHDGISNTRNAIYLLKIAGIIDK